MAIRRSTETQPAYYDLFLGHNQSGVSRILTLSVSFASVRSKLVVRSTKTQLVCFYLFPSIINQVCVVLRCCKPAFLLVALARTLAAQARVMRSYPTSPRQLLAAIQILAPCHPFEASQTVVRSHPFSSALIHAHTLVPLPAHSYPNLL